MVKILHVVMALGVGGLEKWLLEVLHNLDRQRFHIDILVHQLERGHLEGEVAKISQILRLPNSANPLCYARDFRRLLVQHGPYQVMHTHLALGGFHLRWAHQVGVPIRIIHTHSDEFHRVNHLPLWRRLARKVSHHFIRRHATVGLAVSGLAAQGRFGSDWHKDPRFQILPCAISLDAFTVKVDRRSIRQALNLPESAFVIGHVGRFVPEKNHDFLIDIAAEVCQQLPEAYFLLIGDGPVRRSIEERVLALNLSSRVVFTGIRNDIPEILQGAVDLFLFPSQYESAGMALVEAQAAGRPCLISDAIPEEVVVIPELVKRLPLSVGRRAWAKAILHDRRLKNFMSTSETVRRIGGTLFDLAANIRFLEALYSATMVA